MSWILGVIFVHFCQQSVTDMSPYVRKTAANAIPKLYRLVEILSRQIKKIGGQP